MSSKAECPGCGAYLSGVWDAMHDGGNCPSCGLPGSTIYEVHEARKRVADKDLTARCEAAMVRAGKAETERDRLREHLEAIRRAVNDPPAEG